MSTAALHPVDTHVADGMPLPRLLAFGAFVVGLSAWHMRTVGDLSLVAVASFAGLAALCWVYGAAVARATRKLIPTSGAAFELLTGFFAVNTLLFMLTLVTPFGIGMRIVALWAGAALLLPAALRSRRDWSRDGASDRASFACIVVCCVAALLWTRDMQPLMRETSDLVVFNAWPDIFIHAREISLFAASHGATTIADIRVAGMTAPLYHVASYLAAAAIFATSQTSALDTFASFQVPLGILLSGLGAFALARAAFGVWPAAVAAMAVVTLPDPYQQGIGIQLLSYHFMSQVNVGTLYGIACACIAWLFVLEGCRQKRLTGIAIGYVVLLVSLFYKAHIFVANAYLLLIYPCFFFTGLRVRWRALIFVVFTLVFVAAIVLSQRIDRVPVMRLDGSGLSAYTHELIDAMEQGRLHDWLNQVLIVGKPPRLVAAALEALMIAVATFGVWLAILPVVLWLQRKRWSAAILLFPVAVVANYFVMTLGLALDSRGIGVPEELLNRPATWAYFVVVVWSVAGLCQRMPVSARARGAVAFAVALALVGVHLASRNLQTYPAWDSYATYADVNSAPACFVKAGEYIRRNAGPADVIQDGGIDPRFILTAVAERQAWVVDAHFGGTSPSWSARLAEIRDLAAESDPVRILGYMRERGIAWYLVDATGRPPAASVAGDALAFSCGPYRLLHVDPS